MSERRQQQRGGFVCLPTFRFVCHVQPSQAKPNQLKTIRSPKVAQYERYWGDQLLPKFAYDEWRERCVDGDGGYLSGSMSARSDACRMLEERMDSYIGDLGISTFRSPMHSQKNLVWVDRLFAKVSDWCLSKILQGCVVYRTCTHAWVNGLVFRVLYCFEGHVDA